MELKYGFISADDHVLSAEGQRCTLGGSGDEGLSVLSELRRGEVEAYVAADCLVLPSDAGETWGLVVNEAMACSRPAIVSDHVGCQVDLVEEGITGFVFPLDDVGALARSLRLASQTDLVQMGQAANRRVTTLCNVENATASTLAAVSRLLQATPSL